MPQHAGDQVAELGVQQEDHGHQGDGDAHDAAGGFQHQQDGRATHDEVQLGGRTGIQYDDIVLPDDVTADHGPGDGQDGVIPGQLVHVARGAGGIQQIDQGQHEAQVHCALDLRREGRRGRRVQMKSGKGDTKDLDKDVEPPLEGAVNGFLVVLGNDLGDVHSLLDLFHGAGIQFVAFFQGKSPCPFFIDHMHSFFVAHPLMSCVSMRGVSFHARSMSKNYQGKTTVRVMACPGSSREFSGISFCPPPSSGSSRVWFATRPTRTSKEGRAI